MHGHCIVECNRISWKLAVKKNEKNFSYSRRSFLSNAFLKIRKSKKWKDRGKNPIVIFRGIFCQEESKKTTWTLTRQLPTSVSLSVEFFPHRGSMPESLRVWKDTREEKILGPSNFFLFSLRFRFPRIIRGYEGTIRKVFNSRPVERIERNTKIS